jgi:hypothetical protein
VALHHHPGIDCVYPVEQQLKRVLFLATALLSLGVQAGAQTTDTSFKGWYLYSGDHPIGGRWEFHFEAYLRRHDIIERWQHVLLRPGVNYRLNDTVTFTVGYAHRRVYVYPVNADRYVQPEHRLWEQVALKQKIGRLTLQHRYRIEQRFLGQVSLTQDRKPNLDFWQYQSRFRYALKATIPLQRGSRETNNWYLALGNEVFLRAGPTLEGHLFEQDRTYIALGHSLTKTSKIEMGYMDRFIASTSGQTLRHEHILHLSFLSTFPFRK